MILSKTTELKQMISSHSTMWIILGIGGGWTTVWKVLNHLWLSQQTKTTCQISSLRADTPRWTILSQLSFSKMSDEKVNFYLLCLSLKVFMIHRPLHHQAMTMLWAWRQEQCLRVWWQTCNTLLLHPLERDQWQWPAAAVRRRLQQGPLRRCHPRAGFWPSFFVWLDVGLVALYLAVWTACRL